MKKSTPAIDKASKYLRRMLDNQVWKPGDMLPSISQMAITTGVSSVPMWKAVNMLAAEGVLEVVQGSGTRVKKGYEESGNVIRKGWLGLRDRIHKDILTGFYPQGALMPSLKEIKVHYGVSHQTLRKALDSLVTEGIILPEHRTYRTISFSPGKAHSSIVLLGWTHPSFEMQNRTPWGEEFLRVCENLCSQMKVNLKIVRFTEGKTCIEFIYQNGTVTNQLRCEDSVLGYLVWAESPNELYRQVVLQLDTCRKPIAVLQEGSQLRLSDIAEHNRILALFSIGTGSYAARNVASFLLQQGHSSIAYISPFHKSDWSKARMYGLKEIYSRQGNHSSVVPCTLNEYGYSHEYRESLKPLEYFLGQLYKTSGAMFPEIVARAILRLRPVHLKIMESEAVKAFMRPMFTKALKKDECTAWVCANDNTAFMAMDFLNEHRARKIAIAAFDDTFEAFRRGLTSYNFNIHGLVQLMLAHVLNPAPRKGKELKSTEIEGMVVVRNTTFKLE